MGTHVGTVRVVFQDDVTALRDIVERELGNLDTCTGLDPATAESYAEARSIAQHWVDAVNAEVASVFPSGAWGRLYAQGRGIESVLRLNWWPRMAAAGCKLPFPQPTAPPEPPLSSDNPQSPLAWLQPLEGLVKALLVVTVLREVREWTR